MLSGGGFTGVYWEERRDASGREGLWINNNKLKLLIYNKNALYAIHKMYFYFFLFPCFL